MVLFKQSLIGVAGIVALTLCAGLVTKSAEAHSGKHRPGKHSTSSPGTTESSDATCSGLTPTIYIDHGTIVGGPKNGQRYRGTIWGTNGNDVIFGTDKSDRIYGKSGTDTLCGFRGNDRIYGNDGKDNIYGGSGNDKLYGGNDDDMILGGSGNDQLSGQGGKDLLQGGKNNDRLYGGRDNDELEGGHGNDKLYGGKHNDLLIGGSGKDRLYGQAGEDDLRGGDDRDRLYGGSDNDDLDGGAGYDRLDGGKNTDTCINGESDRACENAPAGITVADVAGLNSSAAETTLAQQGLNITLSYEFNSTIAADLVISQSPAAAMEVAAGSTVELVISKGPASVIAGRVTTPAGAELQGIMVSAASSNPNAEAATVDTNNSGLFSLQLSAGAAYTLKLSADDYADQVVLISSPMASGGLVTLDITMIERAAAVSFNEDTGDTIIGIDGSKVTLSPDSFEVGASGDFKVSITPVDVSNASTLAAFPGDFSGNSSGSTGPIVPLGTVEFEFTLDGQPVNLLPGQTAQIEIPIYVDTYPNGDDVSVGDSIALWSLNEETGLWFQEGTGMVVANALTPSGLALQASVSHFSWWNCDVSINAATANITILGTQSTGTALIKGRAPDLINWRGTSVQSSPITVPDPASLTGARIPGGIEVCYSATLNYDNGQSGLTPEVCVTAPPNGTVNITLNAALPGPLQQLVVNQPRQADGSVSIFGFINTPIERLILAPNTAESSVTYSIASGSLPNGIDLNDIDATRDEIAGVPTESGSFQVVVQGIAEGDIASVVVNYEISANAPPPLFQTLLPPIATWFANLDGSLFVDLSSMLDDLSGPVTSWELNPVNPLLDIFPPTATQPVFRLEATPGTIPPAINIEENPIWYSGSLTAIGPGGASSIDIEIYRGFGDGDGGPQQQ